MSGVTSIGDPRLTAAQILTRLETLEQNQLAGAAALAPAITGPLGVRILSASSPSQILAAIPGSPRRQPNPFYF